MTKHPLTTFLWFDHQAEEAARFYTGIFKDSRLGAVTRYNEAGRGTPGAVMTAAFTLNGQEFVALNGGPIFKFSPAVSFQITCETQEEIDYYWDKLSEGGEKVECGWLTDRYGVSWQVTPRILLELMSDPDPAKANRVTAAMLKMKKFEIEAIKAAAR